MAVAMATRRTPLVRGGGHAGAASPMSMADVTSVAAAAAEAASPDEMPRR